MKHVIILGVQVPFVRGGAEIHVESLTREINKIKNVKAELVQLPFKWYPEEQILNDIMAWRLLDLSESNGTKIDLVIALKFPSYAIDHHNKALWLIHQHRTLYDLENTEYDSWRFQKNSRVIRKKIRQLDNRFLAEFKRIYTNGKTTAKRLKKFNGFEAEPLFPVPHLAERIQPGEYGNKIIYIGRLEPNKRVDLLISSLPFLKNVKVSIIGKGRDEDLIRLKKLIADCGVSDKCDLVGYLSDDELLDYLSRARGIFYSPFDEEYGYATIEAFLAKKPVITCDDSGEVQSFVKETGGGLISDTDPKNIAENISKIYKMSDHELNAMALPGYEFAKKITWDKIIEKLVLENI